MVIGVGIDVVSIDRMDRVMDRWGDLFLNRVFTEREITRCRGRKRPAECFATRFAAKEAFLKAIGWGLRNGIRWTDIEVENDPLGKPSLLVQRRAKEALHHLTVEKTFLTLSHDQPFAVAHVLLEGRDA
jgi:holo-[acyl-carrier protein] synthase